MQSAREKERERDRDRQTRQTRDQPLCTTRKANSDSDSDTLTAVGTALSNENTNRKRSPASPSASPFHSPLLRTPGTWMDKTSGRGRGSSRAKPLAEPPAESPAEPPAERRKGRTPAPYRLAPWPAPTTCGDGAGHPDTPCPPHAFWFRRPSSTTRPIPSHQSPARRGERSKGRASRAVIGVASPWSCGGPWSVWCCHCRLPRWGRCGVS